MAGIELISCQDLYNLLNQSFRHPYVSDPNYLLLLDARPWVEYECQHVVTAKFAPREDGGASEDAHYEIPCGMDGNPDIQYKKNVVVYDGATKDLPKDNVEAAELLQKTGDPSNRAYQCANELQVISRNPVKILQGGFQLFSARYHFLRTQKMIYMPRELEEFKTYPIEIIPGMLYLGNESQGNDLAVQKALKIKGQVVAQEEYSTIAPPCCDYVLHCRIEDSCRADISAACSNSADFINGYLENDLPVLVWSKNETSRATTIVTAYLMKSRRWRLETALNYVLGCHRHARPNRGFLQQLLNLENDIFGAELQDEEAADADI